MRHTNDTIGLHYPLGIFKPSVFLVLFAALQSRSIGGNNLIIRFLTIITRPIVASKLWRIDIERKTSFQRSVYTEFLELVSNLTMDVKVKCKLCPPANDVF